MKMSTCLRGCLGEVQHDSGRCGETYDVAFGCLGRLMPWGSFSRETIEQTKIEGDALKTLGKSTYATLLRHFRNGDDSRSGFGVKAFPAYRLSWYLMLSGLEDGLKPYLFPLDNLIAKGVQFVLALLYLGFLYAQLDDCVNNVVCSVGRYNVVTHVDLCFLQMFLPERFFAVAPKHI